MAGDHYKYPRLYNKGTALDAGQTNYLKNVLRKKPGDKLRVFDGKNGEYWAEIIELSKKSGSVIIGEQIRTQPTSQTKTHLLFAPLKKNRMDFVIEKCTELGITDFHPVLTNRTELRKIRQDRLQTQILEACEQSERLTIPNLHNLTPLEQKITQWNETPHIIGCIEREDAPHISTLKPQDNYAFLIGPVGGFSEEEREYLLNNRKIKPASLGKNILRAETASILCATLPLFIQ